mmetsp:Transcript_14533/g.43393  ORF Transcript_14533/g.43393 Transcript_14533/m.43393 type:complete len:151 (+) Transcript_14533:302-754(+)
MPLYHLVTTTSARASPETLVDLFRSCAKKVTQSGGLVRSCEHYGLRRLPHKFRSRHASAGQEGRYHSVGRHVAMYFDCAPRALPEVEQILRMHHDVLRFTTMKRKPAMDCVNSTKRNNPWRVEDDLIAFEELEQPLTLEDLELDAVPDAR